jgi:hypothetical protein
MNDEFCILYQPAREHPKQELASPLELMLVPGFFEAIFEQAYELFDIQAGQSLHRSFSLLLTGPAPPALAFGQIQGPRIARERNELLAPGGFPSFFSLPYHPLHKNFDRTTSEGATISEFGLF